MPVKQPEGAIQWDFMSIYELEGDDPIAVLRNMGAANVQMSELLESSSTLSVIGVSVHKDTQA